MDGGKDPTRNKLRARKSARSSLHKKCLTEPALLEMDSSGCIAKKGHPRCWTSDFRATSVRSRGVSIEAGAAAAARLSCQMDPTIKVENHKDQNGCTDEHNEVVGERQLSTCAPPQEYAGI